MFGKKDDGMNQASDRLSEAYAAVRANAPGGWRIPEPTVEGTDPYDPNEYSDSGELTEALKAVGEPVASPGLGGRGAVPAVIGFYYGGSPVVARLSDDEPSLALAHVLGAMLCRVSSIVPDNKEPDPEVIQEAQLSALRAAQYAVGHPDGSEPWAAGETLADLARRVANGVKL